MLSYNTLAALALACCTLLPAAAGACPFCMTLEPTLSQLRESADEVLLAEVVARTRPQRFEVHRHIKPSRSKRASGTLAINTLSINVDTSAAPGSLVLLFGTGTGEGGKAREWRAVAVDETSYAYFARAPAARAKPADRLAYFGRFLEHPDPLIARDVYFEFARASLAEVAEAARTVPMDRLRALAVDERIDQRRKGLYAVLLGAATAEKDRKANAELLEKLITAPADDFRAGFDGVLAAYLMLEGPKGLELVRSRYLANAQAAHGDVRHAVAAVRFCHESCPAIPKQSLAEAMLPVLKRPELADQVIVDLARWKATKAMSTVAGLYTPAAPARLKQAIVGYLRACPGRAALDELQRISREDPEGVAAAEQALASFPELGK